LHRSHNFTGCGTNHREAKDAVVAVANKSFHKALPLIGGLRPKYRIHRQPCNAGEDTLTFRFAFAKPDASERGNINNVVNLGIDWAGARPRSSAERA
jgi:hypothetical protein